MLTLTGCSPAARGVETPSARPEVSTAWKRSGLAVPFLVRGAPMVTTMHAELARLFASALGLSPPPVALPDIAISLVWHASYDDDPGHAWLRRVIGRLAADVKLDQAAL